MIDRFSKNLTSYHWLLWDFLYLLGILFLAIFQNSNFSIIVNASHNNFLDQFFKYITFLGDGRFVFFIALIFLFVNRQTGISILISLIINTILVSEHFLVKFLRILSLMKILMILFLTTKC